MVALLFVMGLLHLEMMSRHHPSRLTGRRLALMLFVQIPSMFGGPHPCRQDTEKSFF